MSALENSFNVSTSSSLDLRVVHSNGASDTLPEMRKELDIIANLVDEYNEELKTLREMAGEFKCSRIQKLYSYLSGYNHLISENDALYAENALRSEYWRRAMALTDVLSVMNAEKRNEWDKQFTADRYYRPPQVIPEFSHKAVVCTVVSLLNDRHQFMQERVLGVFKSLSRSHKTNKAFGFSTRMITTGVCELLKYPSGLTKPDYKKSGIEPLEELRVICAYFRGDLVMNAYDTKKLVETSVEHEGFRNWISIDGHSIRFRIYKNGSMHIEIHPDLADKLNNILAAIVPLALPAERFTHYKKTALEFPALKNCIDFNSRMLIADLHFKQEEKEGRRVWSLWRSTGKLSSQDHSDKVISDVFHFMGARITAFNVAFDYDPSEALRYICQVGDLPEIVSHQFYPSSKRISDYIDSVLTPGEGDTLLEPSAGHGGLIQSISDSTLTTCVELDPLNCIILRAKGYEVINGDFIAWSTANQSKKFSCIAMNPPFADKRAKLYLQAAASHLEAGGRLAAVLPLSLEHDDNLLGEQFHCQWLETFHNEFENTRISVRVLYAERI